MNVFHKVTIQSLKKNRVRTLVTIVGIILSASMICAVTTFAASMQNYAVKDRIYAAGNWYGRSLGKDLGTYEMIRDSGKIEGAVYLQELGYAVAEGCKNELKPYIYLLGAGDGAEDFLPVHITSGRFPETSDEILLPEHLYANGGVQHSIGEKLTLPLGQRVWEGDTLTQETPYQEETDGSGGETLQVRETRVYTVVGFYERLSWRIEDRMAPGYTALTAADEEISPDDVVDVYFRTKKPNDIYNFMSQNDLGGDTNRDLLMVLGTFRFDGFSTMLYSLAAIVTALIMFGSVALIYNAFSISVSERTKQFGLLSSVGATKKQLKRMVLFEALVVSAVGIPLGILAGIGGIGVTIFFIGSRFRSIGFHGDLTLSVSPLSIGIAAVVSLITVLISAWIPSKRATKISAVEAIRQNQDITSKNKKAGTSKLTYRLFGLPGVLAAKHYKRSRKKYRATVLSLFMSIVLFVSASAFTEYLTMMVSNGLESVDYDLVYQVYPEEWNGLSPDELLDRIRTVKSVTGAAYARERYGGNVKIRSEYLTERGADYLKKNLSQNAEDPQLNIYLRISFVNDETYRELLKKHGLREETYMDPEHPLALALDGMTQFNLYTQKYETLKIFSRNEFEVEFYEDKKIPGYFIYDIDSDDSGNLVYRYMKEDTQYEDGEFIDLTQQEATQKYVLSVGKVITEKPDYIRSLSDFHLLYPLSLANAVFPDFDVNAKDACYYTIQSSSHAESYEAIKTVLSESGLSYQNLFDMAAVEESDRNTVLIIRVFSYGFIVLISLIAAANVFNTISTNIALRRREFAMLKSVGMSGRGFSRMMNYECLLYGSRALLYGLPVSCGVTWLIYLAIMEGYETTFRLPWAAIGIEVLSVFLVVFATMLYAMSKVKKENPIDALKNENL